MLSEKDRELIGLGASIAAGCQPCTRFHLRAASIAGANDAEINQAVNDALCVRRHATEVMAQIVGQYPKVPSSDRAGSQETLLLDELVAIGAAHAVNSVTGFETHFAAARKLGATDGQILTVLKIACAVKNTAAKKVEEAEGRAMGAMPAETEDCCNQTEERVSAQAVHASGRDHSGTSDCSPQCGCGDGYDG